MTRCGRRPPASRFISRPYLSRVFLTRRGLAQFLVLLVPSPATSSLTLLLLLINGVEIQPCSALNGVTWAERSVPHGSVVLPYLRRSARGKIDDLRQTTPPRESHFRVATLLPHPPFCEKALTGPTSRTTLKIHDDAYANADGGGHII